MDENYEPTLEPIFAFKSALDYPNGIFSPNIRNKIRDKINNKKYTEETFDIKLITPAKLINNFARAFHNDISLLNREDYPLIEKPHFNLEGKTENLWSHPMSKLSASCCINTEQGHVVIGEGVVVSPFSFLRGPLYIGAFSQLHSVNINSSRVGMFCRLGGEISHSLIGDFTNKAHEGFLGHSIVGDWVNLGAMTTTSDLKNNYGQVKLIYRSKEYQAGVIKIGSIFGDFTKTSIGTMLNTGTILDTGSFLFSGRPVQKYYPPFFWGGEKPVVYQLDRFLVDIKIIMKRKNKQPSKELVEKIKERHNKFA